jgi:hypothetical protein
MLCSWLPGRADGDPCGGVDVRRIQSQWHNANGILIWFELPGTSESGAEMSQNRLPSPKAICTGDEADGIGLSGCGVGQHAIDRGKVVSRFAPGLAQEQRPHLFRVFGGERFRLGRIILDRRHVHHQSIIHLSFRRHRSMLAASINAAWPMALD